MADRRTNVEIEDILTSIRRLVSEEARPPLTRQPPRLVLTAANRIDRPPAAAPQPAMPRPEPAGATARPAEAEDALEARIAELEALLGLAPVAFEPDEGEALGPAPATFERLRRADAAPAPTDAPARPAPQASQPAPAPHGSPQSDPPAAAGGSAPSGTVADEAAGAAPARRPFGPRDTAPSVPPSADPWEETDRTAFPEVLPEDSEVIDETALRDLVREILREELQGVLGERITHNVRKLVRAEIARALAARDL